MKLLVAILLSLSNFAVAFPQPPDLGQPLTPNELWRQDGQLVTVQVSKKSPIRIFVVGREEAKVNPSNLSVTVRRAHPYPARELQLDQRNNYYTVSNAQDLKGTTDLEVTTHIKDQPDEIFHFHLDHRNQ